VSNLVKAATFYDSFLPVLGFSRITPISQAWLGYRKSKTTFWFTVSRRRRVTRKTPHIPADGADHPISDHIGFLVPSSKQVEDLEAALRVRGFVPLYSTGRERIGNRSWYTSNAWKDPRQQRIRNFRNNARMIWRGWDSNP